MLEWVKRIKISVKMTICYCMVDPSMSTLRNQSIENAGVAFVEGANERNSVVLLRK